MKRNSLHFGTIIILAFLIFLVFPAASRAQEPLKLGLPPYLSAADLYEHFSPLADYLCKELGRPVVLVNEPDYETHLLKLQQGDVDIAFLGPASYISYTRRFGKLPLLAAYETNGRRTYRGFIVVLKTSSITKLSQLRGKSFAFGDVKSTMGHIVPRYLLMRVGIDLAQLSRHSFLSNQQNIALGILAGDFDAGAVREDIYDQYLSEGLRAVAQSDPIPDHLLVARAGLPTNTVHTIAKILLSLKKTEHGRSILNAMQKNLTALVPVQDSDYEPIRTIVDHLARAGVTL